jgi:hypothetical protein
MMMDRICGDLRLIPDLSGDAIMFTYQLNFAFVNLSYFTKDLAVGNAKKIKALRSFPSFSVSCFH